MSRNPFDTFGKRFKGVQSPLDVFTATPVAGKKEQERRMEQSSQMPAAVSLPPHIFTPESGQSVDIRELANVLPGTTVNLIVFTAPAGGTTKFTGYAIFNDALNFDLIEFIPTVNNSRVFPFHGDPQRNFKIGLGLTPDLGNNALIECQLDLNPGDVLKWTFRNDDVVDIAAGVRMRGYTDSTLQRKIGRFGG